MLQLFGDRAGEHLVEQPAGHRSPGEQVAFALPGVFGRVLGCQCCVYLGVDVAGIDAPNAPAPVWVSSPGVVAAVLDAPAGGRPGPIEEIAPATAR